MLARMTLVLAAYVGCGLTSSGALTHASEFPSRALRIIVPTAPGGSADIVARTVGRALAHVAGQRVMVEHRSAARGSIGAELAARAPADGQTLLLATDSLLVKSTLPDWLSVSMTRDFAPVSLIAFAPFALVLHPSLPVDSVEELVRYARARPGELNYPSGLRGASLHVAAELFKSLASVDIVRVPYRTAGMALVGLLRGDTEIGFLPAIIVSPHVRIGRMRALGVTSAERLTALPQIPTMTEAGMAAYDFSSWYGLLVPAGTPEKRIAVTNGHLRNAASRSQIANRLAGMGAEVALSSPGDFGEHLRDELARWKKAVEQGALR